MPNIEIHMRILDCQVDFNITRQVFRFVASSSGKKKVCDECIRSLCWVWVRKLLLWMLGHNLNLWPLCQRLYVVTALLDLFLFQSLIYFGSNQVNWIFAPAHLTCVVWPNKELIKPKWFWSNLNGLSLNTFSITLRHECI